MSGQGVRTKRHYRSREELRVLMVNEGIELLVGDGMKGGENVTIARVVERLMARGEDPVTKGSVLGKDRLWPTQRDFQLEVQRTFASQIGELGLTAGGTYEAAGAVLAAADLTTVAGRRAAVRELCRVAGEASFDGLLQSRIWRIWLAIWATAMTTDDEAAVGESIREGELNAARILTETLYGPFAELVGLRVRPEFGADGLLMFTVCAAALSDGLAMRVRYSSTPLENIERAGHDGGEPERWHLFAIGFEALVRQFFEPIPVADPTDGA